MVVLLPPAPACAADWEPVLSPPADPAANRLETVLVELVQALGPPAPVGARGRPPILPGLLLWSGLLVCLLRGWTSQRALWRLLSSRGLWRWPRVAVSDDAVYKRLETAGPGALERLFADLSAVLAARLAPYADAELAPFATGVVALDETTLDPVARTLLLLHGLPPGDDRLLPGKLAGVFDLRAQQWRTLRYLPDGRQNEKVAARDLAATLPRGTLLVCDLGDFGFAWFDDLTDAGHFWVSRLRGKTSHTAIHTFYQHGETFDGLVWLGAHRADRAKHAVRLVRFRQGATLFSYLTNVRSPHLFPLAEIARLYPRRWDIELAIKLVKRELGLHLLWSAKEAVILTQVWGALILAQILLALRQEAAGRAGVDPFEVSLPLLVAYLPQYAAQGGDPLAAFLADAHDLGFIRPSRRLLCRAPDVPAAQVRPPPAGLELVRAPRDARRKCGPRRLTTN